MHDITFFNEKYDTDEISIRSLSNPISLFAPLSWTDCSTDCVINNNLYVIQSNNDNIVIDTGLTLHRAALEPILADLLSGTRRRKIVMTKREPDTMINLPWLVRRFNFNEVVTGSITTVKRFFTDFDDFVANENLKASELPEFTFVRPEGAIEFYPFCLEIIYAPIQILSTHWYYQPESGSLFSSDCWSGIPIAQDGTSAIDDPELITIEMIQKIFRAAFGWLWATDTAPIIDDLRAVFANRSVRRICPTYGQAIVGEICVKKVVELTVSVLEKFSHQKPVSELSAIDLRAIRQLAGTDT